MYENRVDKQHKLFIFDSYRNGGYPFMKKLDCMVVVDSCHVIKNALIPFANPTTIKAKNGTLGLMLSL